MRRVHASTGTESALLVLHATKKLLDRVGKPTVEPSTPSSTRLGSWYGTALFWRPQVALLVNEMTFLPALMPLAPAASLVERVPSWLARTLEAHAVPRTFIDAELVEAGELGLAKTNSRSVVGVMTEFVRLADWRKDEINDEGDLIDVALALSEVPTSPLYKRHISPDRELAAVVADSR